jgi:hypothetical protein
VAGCGVVLLSLRLAVRGMLWAGRGKVGGERGRRWVLGRKKEENRNLNEKTNTQQSLQHSQAMVFSIILYLRILRIHLLPLPEMSASQPFPKGFGDSMYL